MATGVTRTRQPPWALRAGSTRGPTPGPTTRNLPGCLGRGGIGPSPPAIRSLFDQPRSLVALLGLLPDLNLLLPPEPVGDRGPLLRDRVERLFGGFLSGQSLVHVEVKGILVLGGARDEDLGIAVCQGLFDPVQVRCGLGLALEV